MTVIAQQVPDLELIHQYAQGCNKSMETLLHRYKDRIYTAIYVLVKDRHLAEDLMQETFLKVIKNIKQGNYAEQGKFLPWALRMAHNLCMDHFRKVQRKPLITLPNGKDITALMADLTEEPMNPTEQWQQTKNLRKLVETLPMQQREVVVLRMYGNLSFKEIADLTGVSINTALGRMRYALINMRRTIQECRIAI